MKIVNESFQSCILDNSLSLRMVQIWAHLLAQAEKNLQSLTSGTLKKSEKQKFTESLHLLIFAIGYFASVHPHAQVRNLVDREVTTI